MSIRTQQCLWSLAIASLVACGGSAPPPEAPAAAEPSAPAAAVAQPAAEPAAAVPAEPQPPVAPDAPPVASAASAEPTQPEPAQPEPAQPEPAGLPGANINIGSMTVDGVTVKDLSCKMAGGGLGGLFGSLTLAAAFGKKKAQLDACAAGQVETTVHWKQAGGRITEVKAQGDDAKRNGCVERALRGAPAAQDAECLGTVVHGK